MLVIFEGVDGSGKTTVIKKLKERFGWEEIEWPGKQKDHKAFVEMVKDFTTNHWEEIHNTKVYLMDRGGVGEILYGTLENRFDKFCLPESFSALMDLWKYCVFVHCSNKNAHKNAIIRGEDGIAKNADIHKILSYSYKEIAYVITNKADIFYDYTEQDAFEKLASDIVIANFNKITANMEAE